MTISIIIPTYNEAAVIDRLLQYLWQQGGAWIKEIIVSDGTSTDDTVLQAQQAGAMVVISPQKGRAAQMNYGATQATGDILYFVHADTLPPRSFATDIIRAVHEGYALGRYRTKFDSSKWLLKINAWFTRYDWFICMGGDQTLFAEHSFFRKTGGFDASMYIMEEFEYVARARKLGRYKIFKQAALVSARKYEGRSWLRVQLSNRKAVLLYKAGAPQDEIAHTYKKMLG